MLFGQQIVRIWNNSEAILELAFNTVGVFSEFPLSKGVIAALRTSVLSSSPYDPGFP